MVLVGPRLGDYAHDASGGAAVLGQVVVTLGLKFLNGVHDGRIVVHPEHGVQVVFPVQHEVVATVASAVHCREGETSERVSSPPASSVCTLVAIDVRHP